MARHLMAVERKDLYRFTMNPGPIRHVRPTVTHSQSDPIPDTYEYPETAIPGDIIPSGESRDVVQDTILSTLPHPLHTLLSEKRKSGSTIGDSPTQSRSSSPYANLASSATSPSVYTLDSFTNYNAARGQRRPSTINRLRSSISTGSSKHVAQRSLVQPADFLIQPEQPEKRFVDAIGMIFPGVCDRTQRAHPFAHFVTSFRLCEPIEYTTALADHGVIYADYCRLIAALLNFLDDMSDKQKRPGSGSA